jgi:hypothetical protein
MTTKSATSGSGTEESDSWLSDPRFWNEVSSIFLTDDREHNNEMIAEFAEVAGVPEERIRAGLLAYIRRYVREMSPYFHRSKGTLH